MQVFVSAFCPRRCLYRLQSTYRLRDLTSSPIIGATQQGSPLALPGWLLDVYIDGCRSSSSSSSSSSCGCVQAAGFARLTLFPHPPHRPPPESHRCQMKGPKQPPVPFYGGTQSRRGAAYSSPVSLAKPRVTGQHDQGLLRAPSANPSTFAESRPFDIHPGHHAHELNTNTTGQTLGKAGLDASPRASRFVDIGVIKMPALAEMTR